MRVIVNPESGWFASLPSPTKNFVMGKLTKAQADKRFPIELQVTGCGVMRCTFPGSVADPKRLDAADQLGTRLAQTLRKAPPWTGASERR